MREGGVGKRITQRGIYSTQLDHELDSLKVTVIFTKAQVFYVRKKLYSKKTNKKKQNNTQGGKELSFQCNLRQHV